jgi:hypothetical protein
MSAKIDAQRDVVDVAEDRSPAIPRHQAVEDAPRDNAGVLAAVRDHDLRHDAGGFQTSPDIGAMFHRSDRHHNFVFRPGS